MKKAKYFIILGVICGAFLCSGCINERNEMETANTEEVSYEKVQLFEHDSEESSQVEGTDFSIIALDRNEVDRQKAMACYKGILEEYMNNSNFMLIKDWESHPWNSNCAFALVDLNNDGIEELLMEPYGEVGKEMYAFSVFTGHDNFSDAYAGVADSFGATEGMLYCLDGGDLGGCFYAYKLVNNKFDLVYEYEYDSKDGEDFVTIWRVDNVAEGNEPDKSIMSHDEFNGFCRHPGIPAQYLINQSTIDEVFADVEAIPFDSQSEMRYGWD